MAIHVWVSWDTDFGQKASFSEVFWVSWGEKDSALVLLHTQTHTFPTPAYQRFTCRPWHGQALALPQVERDINNAKYHLASGMCSGHLQPVYSRVCWHFFLQSYEILTGGTQEALRKTKIPAQPLSNCVILTNYSIVQNFIFLIWKWW